MKLSKEAIEAAKEYNETLIKQTTMFKKEKDGTFSINLAVRIQQACEDYYKRKMKEATNYSNKTKNMFDAKLNVKKEKEN
jgi:hypothetical protein